MRSSWVVAGSFLFEELISVIKREKNPKRVHHFKLFLDNLHVSGKGTERFTFVLNIGAFYPYYTL
jgi:hypothetical protein